MSVVTLDVEKFRAIFPEFSGLSDDQLQFLFDEAGDYLNNTDYSLIIDPAKRERLLYLLMAHLAYIRYGYLDASGVQVGGSGVVGRVTSATQGSTSASFDLGATGEGTAWYTQSPYGLSFWQATKVYRLAVYYPGGDYYFGRRYPGLSE